MSRLALATRELEGFTPGGIGSVVASLLRQALADGLEVDLLVPRGAPIAQPGVRERFGDAVSVVEVDAASSHSRGPAHALARGFEHTVAARWRERGWGGVEFPDYGGWAGTLAPRRRVDPALEGLRVAVRVHGPASVIHWLEGRPPSHEALVEYELERAALLHAELLLASLEPVFDEVAGFFRLEPGPRRDVRFGLPPFAHARLGAATPAAPAARDVVFSTKLQAIKQPALFVLGAARLMEAAPWWHGRACFAAHGASGPELEHLLARVPRALRERFVVIPPVERARTLREGVVVVPSKFETLCLAAWEPALDGVPVVLNADCPAFAPGTPLREFPGVSAFDGTASGLARALEAALQQPAEAPREAPPPPPGWWVDLPPQAVPRPVGRRGRRVLVLGAPSPAQEQGARLAGFTVEALPPGVLGRLRGAEPRAVRAHLAAAASDVVAVLRPGDPCEPTFLSEAAEALERDAALALLSPAPAGHAPYLGAAATLGVAENALAAPTSVFRGELASLLPAAGDWEHAFWVMALRAAGNGAFLAGWWRPGGPAGRPTRKLLRNWVRHQAGPLLPATHPWGLDFVRRAGWSRLLG